MKRILVFLSLLLLAACQQMPSILMVTNTNSTTTSSQGGYSNIYISTFPTNDEGAVFNFSGYNGTIYEVHI